MQQQTLEAPRPADLIGEAIRERRAISATYNGATLDLEPYNVFVRNGALFLSAFNPHKNRRVDSDPELGIFNLSGLSDVAIGDAFTPAESLAALDESPERQVLIAVEPLD